MIPRSPVRADPPKEEEEEEGKLQKPDTVCAYCAENLEYAEEVFYLTVSNIFDNGKERVVIPFLCEEGEYEGDYFYDPYFFCFACWENVVERINDMVDDTPDVLPSLHDQKSLTKCHCCKSDIYEWEIFGAVYLGELHISPRMPTGKISSTFVENSNDPFAICIGCLSLLQEHEIELWEEDLNQIGECSECTHARCWRLENSCGCPCHE